MAGHRIRLTILDIYRILFVRGYNTTNALKIIEAEIPDSEAKDAITTFVRDSVRGVVKGFSPVERNRDSSQGAGY